MYLPAVLMIFKNLFSWIWDQRSHCILELEAHSFKSFLNRWCLRAESARKSVCGLRHEGLLPAWPSHASLGGQMTLWWHTCGVPPLLPLLHSNAGTLLVQEVCSDLPGPWLQQQLHTTLLQSKFFSSGSKILKLFSML